MSHTESGDSSSAKKRKRPRKENSLEHFDIEQLRNHLRTHFEEGTCFSSGDSKDLSRAEETQTLHGFNQDVARRELVKKMLLADLPITAHTLTAFTATPETTYLHPDLERITLRQVKTTIKELYNEEKSVLMEYLRNYSGKIGLSCKMWKSCQGFHYIALTAHYIANSDWKLEKKALAFRLLDDANDVEVVADAIVCELADWGIENKIHSFTLDDYDTGYIMKTLREKYEVYVDVTFHIHCFSDAINLVVRDCLREIESFVERMRLILVHIKASKSGCKEFRELCDALSVEYWDIPYLPVNGKWDYTLYMLDGVTHYRTVIDRYILGKEYKYPPFSDDDWSFATIVGQFLDAFSTATSSFSTGYATSCAVLGQIYEISCLIEKHHSNRMFSSVCTEMKRQLSNFWEESPVLFGLSSIFDPRTKLVELEAQLEFIYQWVVGDVDSGTYSDVLNEVIKVLEDLFEKYQSQKIQGKQISSRSSPRNRMPSGTSTYKMLHPETRKNERSELQRYLEDPISTDKSYNFDFLGWWKLHECSYPVLSTIARDLLTIPVSTVFSDLAFNVDDKLLDDEGTILSASMLNSSKCVRDWYRSKMRPVKMEWSSEDENTE